MCDFKSALNACCLFATCMSRRLFVLKQVRLKSNASRVWDFSGDGSFVPAGIHCLLVQDPGWVSFFNNTPVFDFYGL